MKRALVVLMGAFMLLAFTAPVMADVWIYADIEKYKYKDVEEWVLIEKDVDIDVVVDLTLDSVAEAEAVVNTVIEGNTVYKSEAAASAIIDGGAFNGAIGIIQVNQAPGNMNNQGNAVSISLDTATELGQFVHAQAAESDWNANNYVDQTNILYLDIINGAFVGAVGIVNVNQAAGNMNNQHNTMAIAIGDAVVALSESDLGQFNIGNYVTELSTIKSDIITGTSFAGATGIVNVNQSAGNMNNQANVISIAAKAIW